MDAAGARYMKRKVKAGEIKADFDERTIVVHYEVEATVLGDDHQAMQVERKQHEKRIRLKMLNEHTNVALLAEEIVAKCKLIHPSKLSHVENLLYQLQQQSLNEDHRAERYESSDKQRRKHKKRERERRRAEKAARAEAKALAAQAKLEKVDDYMDKLYEESMDEKIEGTGKLLQLARHAGNLEELISNETLMAGLSRTLKEDHKRSVELVTNIMYIFFSFSNFSQMHDLVKQYRIGAETIRVIHLETQRHALRVQEMNQLQAIAELEENDQSIPNEMWAGLDSKRRQRHEKGKRVDIARERKKAAIVMRKQDKLLYVCFHVLLNLAEDVSIERKMVKKKIIKYLAAALDRNNTELLVLVIVFLKKLSIFEENRNKMVSSGVIEKLVKFVPCNNQYLLNMVLRLLLNLSFDAISTESMIKFGLIPKLVSLLKLAPYRQITLKLLYHLSKNDRCKSMFTYTECIPILLQLMIQVPGNAVPKELVAVAINLSWNDRNAEILCKHLKELMRRVMGTHDVCLMKVIRNIARWTYQDSGSWDENENAKEGKEDDNRRHSRSPWQAHYHDLVKLSQTTDNMDMLLEVLGTLSNLTANDLPRGDTFQDIFIKHKLPEFLRKHMVPGFAQDDIILEAIMWLGTMATQQDCAEMIVDSPLIHLVIDNFKEKKEDAEILIQCLHVFHVLLGHSSCTSDLLQQPHLIQDVCAALSHKNEEVVSTADKILNIVLEIERGKSGEQRQGREFWNLILARRYQSYNKEWLAAAEKDDVRDHYEESHDDYGDSRDYDHSDRSDDMSQSHSGDSGHWNSYDARRESVQMNPNSLQDQEDDWGRGGDGRWEDSYGN